MWNLIARPEQPRRGTHKGVDISCQRRRRCERPARPWRWLFLAGATAALVGSLGETATAQQDPDLLEAPAPLAGSWAIGTSDRALEIRTIGDRATGTFSPLLTCFRETEQGMTGRRTATSSSGASTWSVTVLRRDWDRHNGCRDAPPETGTIRVSRDRRTAQYCPDEGGCTALIRRTRRWEVRLRASGGSSLGRLGIAVALGQLRRRADHSLPAGRPYDLGFLGGGLDAGFALPIPDPNIEWVPFDTARPVWERDFDLALCRFTSATAGLGYVNDPTGLILSPHDNPLDRLGYGTAWLTFPRLGATVTLSGRTRDTGLSAGIALGACLVDLR